MKLKQILNVPGVVGVLTFSPKGELNDYRGNITADQARMAAHMCYSNSSLMQMQGRLFSDYSRQPEWKNFESWAMFGPELGIYVSGDTACFLNRSEASFNQVSQVVNSLAHPLEK
ncbi:DUF2173 family protein [Thiohalorhabdus methylotrophus]|uniref:DUF2173 family protein n=1 Tax=Thiohalorhabdus methylotrophus TaxID=3242694 RepID=A0ABV4TZ47_9GAMM